MEEVKILWKGKKVFWLILIWEHKRFEIKKKMFHAAFCVIVLLMGLMNVNTMSIKRSEKSENNLEKMDETEYPLKVNYDVYPVSLKKSCWVNQKKCFMRRRRIFMLSVSCNRSHSSFFSFLRDTFRFKFRRFRGISSSLTHNKSRRLPAV
jgi:hypothetical protein